MQHIKGMVLMAVFTSLLLAGCLKDTEEFIPRQEYIETSAFGVVLDDLNLPVENATVAYEGEKTLTDSNGIFIFSDVVIPSSGGHLEVSASGYFSTFQMVNPVEDTRSINIHMNALGQPYTLSGANGGVINSGTGIEVSFPRQAFSKINGDLFQGSVTSYTGWVDPLDKDAYDQIPGGHFGKDNDEELQLLEHYGTIYLESFTPSGEELFLTENTSIEIRFPVSNELVGQIPSQMPLWKLDAEEGLWIEYGVADLQGEHYVATVEEIGVWSIQLPSGFSRISGRVKAENNRPVERARIALSREGQSVNSRVWTDSDGRFTLFYPIDEYLEIKVEDECQTVLYETTQAPILGDYELETFQIDPGDNYWTLSGVITECGALSTGITSGYSLIKTSLYRWITPVNANGAFITGLFNCSDNFVVIGKDILKEKGTNAVDISEFDDKERNYSLGVMQACR